MSEVKPMPDCWVVVKDGQIIGTHDEPAHLNGIDAVRYVPAAEIEATKNSAAVWHSRYTEVCQDRIALRQKYGHEIEALDAEVEALRADKQVLLSHMDTFMRVSNDPAIYNLAKVVTERFAIQEK